VAPGAPGQHVVGWTHAVHVDRIEEGGVGLVALEGLPNPLQAATPGHTRRRAAPQARCCGAGARRRLGGGRGPSKEFSVRHRVPVPHPHLAHRSVRRLQRKLVNERAGSLLNGGCRASPGVRRADSPRPSPTPPLPRLPPPPPAPPPPPPPSPGAQGAGDGPGELSKPLSRSTGPNLQIPNLRINTLRFLVWFPPPSRSLRQTRGAAASAQGRRPRACAPRSPVAPPSPAPACWARAAHPRHPPEYLCAAAQ
jgi:hypothetical protein